MTGTVNRPAADRNARFRNTSAISREHGRIGRGIYIATALAAADEIRMVLQFSGIAGQMEFSRSFFFYLAYPLPCCLEPVSAFLQGKFFSFFVHAIPHSHDLLLAGRKALQCRIGCFPKIIKEHNADMPGSAAAAESP
jgi:hypothetical protein